MKETTNYKLKKIELTDSPPDITVHSDNFDVIDEEMKKSEDHTVDTSNPHVVTKNQVGLGNVDNVEQASKTEFDSHNGDATKHITSAERTKWNAVDNKVDKVTGKGLSTNDYTTAEKNKLSGIQAGAQVNTVTSVAGKTGAVTVSKSDLGLSNVDNVRQASKTEFVAHKAEKVHQGELHGLRTNAEKELEYFDGVEWKPSYFGYTPPDDLTNSPGSKHLISGTMEEGFFGEVPSSELITGDALVSECGISQGASQHSTAGWLKFAYKGEIQFVAKKPIRHSISWDAINTANCVYGDSGDKTVVIGGKTYKVTLMRALEPSNDPKTVVSADRGAVNHHSEWNRLMCQIHEEAINKNWNYPDNIESDIGILEHSLGSGSQGMYNDADLVVKSGDGRYSWCQEMSTSTSTRLHRGGIGVSESSRATSSGSSVIYGWRPVLRLIG